MGAYYMLELAVKLIVLPDEHRFDSLELDRDRRTITIIDVTTYDDLIRDTKDTGNHVSGYKDRIAALQKKEHIGLAKYTSDLLDVVARQQKCQGRSGRPLIWVAESSAASLVSQALRRADWGSDRQSDAHRSVLESTYGVIRLQSHHRTFLHSWILAVGQASSYWLLRNYGISRDSVTPTAAASLSNTGILRIPSMGVFVICALLYGVFAMLLYHINRADYFQQLCLITGLAAGLLLSPSGPLTVPESPVSVHTFEATTSVALVCSACGHWVWRTFFSTREARLEKKLAEWGEDARGMDKNTHVIRFCELA